MLRKVNSRTQMEAVWCAMNDGYNFQAVERREQTFPIGTGSNDRTTHSALFRLYKTPLIKLIGPIVDDTNNIPHMYCNLNK